MFPSCVCPCFWNCFFFSLKITFSLIPLKAFALDLNFEENGKEYTEKIKVNWKGNTVEYDVPEHGQVRASKYLVDFTSVSKLLLL